MAAELIQIVYDDSQRKECYPFAKVHFNETLTIFFENSVISELVSTTKADKIGVCSWKLKEKLRWYIGQRREITEEVINSDYYVLSFTRNTKYHQMLAAADQNHTGFRQTMQKLCDFIGINLPNEVRIPIYQNHFMARTEIYQDYVEKYLNPAIMFMTHNEEMNVMSMADSNYSTLAGISREQRGMLKSKIGIDYYPMAPFILERLFSIYVHNKNIHVTWL